MLRVSSATMSANTWGRAWAGFGRWYACPRDAAGSRSQRELRAAQRVLGAPCARARLEGEGGARRGAPAPPARRERHVPLAARDPARPLRPRPTSAQAHDLAPRPLRAGRLAVRLLRHGG